MSRDARLYLEDIADSAAKILRYTTGMDLETFVGNEQVVDAVVRNLEIIGEAAKRRSICRTPSRRSTHSCLGGKSPDCEMCWRTPISEWMST